MVQAMPVSVSEVDAPPPPPMVVVQQHPHPPAPEQVQATAAVVGCAAQDSDSCAAAAAAGVSTVAEMVAEPPVAAAVAVAHAPSTASQQKQFFTSSLSPPDSAVDSKPFKPIRVDNWGIFLLNRLQSYFQKREFCDLTIRFPSKNAQIKVHSLVVNSCTDFFAKMEREGRIVDGVLNLPEEFGPDSVAPIIRFMYTGRLDIKTGMFTRLKRAAELLEMAVLTKLMEAQLLAPPPSPENRKKRRLKPDDPLRQIKKIKKIEKKFTADEKKARIAAAKMSLASENREQIRFVEGAIPGKKLPIWKKRSTHQPGTNGAVDISAPRPTNLVPVPPPPHLGRGMVLKPISRPPHGAKLRPISGSSITNSVRSQSDPLPKSYGNKDGGSPEKPRVPRQIRELQQSLNFEKVRRAGARDVGELPGKKEMSMEEIGEAMAEQKRRLQENEEDDYFDNDAGLDYDEAAPEEQSEIDDPGPVNTNIIVGPAAKPILKTEPSESTPRKSVRFSLTPAVAPTKQPPSASASPSPSTSYPSGQRPSQPQEPDVIVPDYNPLQKQGRLTKTRAAVPAADFDSTLDEFNKAIEAEEGEDDEDSIAEPLEEQGRLKHQTAETSAGTQTMRSRSGRVIIKRSPDSRTDTSPASKRGRPTPTNAKAASPSGPSSSEMTPSPPPAKRPRKLATAVAGDVCQDSTSSIDLPTATASCNSTRISPPLARQKKEPGADSAAAAAAAATAVDQAKVVQEMLKKYPNLLKEGKNVKLKVVGKDCHGRSVVKHITLKAAAAPAAAPSSSSSAPATKRQPYTARRGRPKTKRVRVGDGDGEDTELHKRTEVFATLDQVAAAGHGATVEVGGELPTALGAQHRQQRQQQQEQRMDPSSEAEALSNVASGIAASLGLAAGNLDHEGRVTAAAVVVPTSAEDGRGSSGGGDGDGAGGDEVSELGQPQTAIMIDYQDPAASAAAAAAAPAPAGGGGAAAQVILASDGSIPAGAVQILLGGSISLASPGVIIAEHPGTSQGATVEAAMAKLHGGEAAASTVAVATVEPMGVTKKKLQMDWEEDEEEGQQGSHSK